MMTCRDLLAVAAVALTALVTSPGEAAPQTAAPQSRSSRAPRSSRWTVVSGVEEGTGESRRGLTKLYALYIDGNEYSGLAGVNVPKAGYALLSVPNFKKLTCRYAADADATSTLATVAQTDTGYYHVTRGSSTFKHPFYIYSTGDDLNQWNPPISSGSTLTSAAFVFHGGHDAAVDRILVDQFEIYGGSGVVIDPCHEIFCPLPDSKFNYEPQYTLKL